MFRTTLVWRLYAITALVIACLIVPLAFVPVPLLILAVYLFSIFNPVRSLRFAVPVNLFLCLALPVLFIPVGGTWFSPLFSLPVIPLFDSALRQTALSLDVTFSPDAQPVKRFRPTVLSLSLGLTLAGVALLALILGSVVLILDVAIVALYTAVILAAVFFRDGLRFMKIPVEAVPVSEKVVAGNLASAQLELKVSTRAPFGGHLIIRPPYNWFFIHPDRFVIDKPVIEVEASFTPPLSGPTAVNIDAAFVDRWGLTQFDFSVQVMELLVIPRARYAEWEARKYLEAGHSSGGIMPAVSASPPRRASRQGVEFYGLRPYQPGDSARTIDWKHTSKLRQVIVKEFIDRTTECAVIALNTSVSDEEERDKLVSDLITGALTFARANIPSAIAAYDHKEVLTTTPLLDPAEALIRSLRLTKEVKIYPGFRRYLAVPDVSRLRGNIQRLNRVEEGAGRRLAEILRLEYAALAAEAVQHPATAALSAVLAGLKSKANILIVSAGNHDASPLAFNRHELMARGYRFVD